MACVAYSGPIDAGKMGARLILFGFPIETVYTDDERDALVERSLRFLLDLEPHRSGLELF